MQDFTGQRVVVMGLGRFGGGVGVTRYLVQHGAQVLVTDTAPAEALRDSIDQLKDLPNVHFRLGGHEKTDFAGANVVVANPAVKPQNNPYLEAARNAGAILTSEIRLLVNQLPNRRHVIGITGSAGKSTVTAMIGQALNSPQATANAWIGGNLGGSLLEHLPSIAHQDWVVLELSSFMLHSLAQDHWSPGIAIITNLGPNHLDWHGSYEHYIQAKQHILDFQSEEGLAVLGPGLNDMFDTGQAKTIHVDQPDPQLGALAVPGEHNRLNATLALTALDLAGNHRDQSLYALGTFAGLAHRLQPVAEHNGVMFYDDSKSTTSDSTERAMGAFDAGRIHLILGGYDKKANLQTLAQHAAEHCRGLYTIGQTGPQIADTAERCEQAPVHRCGNLDHAMQEALGRARPGDVILLSPGCASWDQFDHYQQRGRQFTQLVLTWTSETGHHP